MQVDIEYRFAYAPLAQMVEHMTFNHGVRSSSLRWSTKKTEMLLRFGLFAFLLCLHYKKRITI